MRKCEIHYAFPSPFAALPRFLIADPRLGELLERDPVLLVEASFFYVTYSGLDRNFDQSTPKFRVKFVRTRIEPPPLSSGVLLADQPIAWHTFKRWRCREFGSLHSPNGFIRARCAIKIWTLISIRVRIPPRSLPAAHHGRQTPTTEGAGRCSLFTDHGHRCLEPREGGGGDNTSQGRVHLCWCSPRYD